MLNSVSSRRGFSLAEFAIVLGVIGLIMGGIWALVSPAQENQKRILAQQEIATVADHVRGAYAGEGGIKGPPATIMTQLVGEGAFPNDMVANATATPPVVNNPWGGIPSGASSFTVCGWNYSASPAKCGVNLANPQPFFAIELAGLANGSCIDLAMNVSGPSGPPGLVGVEINGGGINPPPLTAALANSGCVAASNTNTIDFVYRLILPPS